jgi:HSP20 family protein
MFALTPFKRTTALLPRMETPFGWMGEEFETLFNRLLGGLPVLETPEWPYRYALTTEEKEKEFVVRAELPGFTPEEVKVELMGERLTIEAEHKEEVKKEEAKEETAERTFAHVKRTITLPPEIELEKLEAIYRNGVLEIHVPRKLEAMGRRIEVKT